MSHHHLMRVLALLGVLCLALALFLPAQVTSAAPLPGGPAVVAPPPPNHPPHDDPITNLINNIISFPFKDLQETFENLFKNWLTDAVGTPSRPGPLASFYGDVVSKIVGKNPDLIGGGQPDWWNTGQNIFQQSWTAMIVFAVAFWPLTLAIVAVIAAKDAVAAASWGLGDLKQILGEWLLCVVLSATSIYWLNWINEISNAMTEGILLSPIGGAWHPNVLTAMTFGAAAAIMAAAGPLGLFVAIFMVLFVIILGLTILTALIMQYMTRFVLLLVVVALAPIVIVLGVLPPLGWLHDMWVKTMVQVMLLGPINALALKFAVFLGGESVSQDPVTAVVHMLGMLGVLSILIAIDGAITSQVFGAMQEVLQKTGSSMAALATLTLAAATFGMGGAVAGGGAAAGATGEAAGGAAAEGASAAGGAASGSSASGGLSGARGAMSAGGLGSARKPSFDHAAGLRAAGRVLARQGGLMGAAGGMVEGIGGIAQDANREARAEQRSKDAQARQDDRDKQRSTEQGAHDAKADARYNASEQQRRDRDSAQDANSQHADSVDRAREGERALRELGTNGAPGAGSGKPSTGDGSGSASARPAEGASHPASSTPPSGVNYSRAIGSGSLSKPADPLAPTSGAPVTPGAIEPSVKQSSESGIAPASSVVTPNTPGSVTPNLPVASGGASSLTDFGQSSSRAPAITDRPALDMGRGEASGPAGSPMAGGGHASSSFGAGGPVSSTPQASDPSAFGAGGSANLSPSAAGPSMTPGSNGPAGSFLGDTPPREAAPAPMLSPQAQAAVGQYFAPEQTAAAQAVSNFAAAHREPEQQVAVAHAAAQAIHAIGPNEANAAVFAQNTAAAQRAIGGGLSLDQLAADAGFAGKPADYLAYRAQNPVSSPADASLSFPSIKPALHTTPGEWDYQTGRALSQAFGLGENEAAMHFHRTRDPQPGTDGSWTQAKLVAAVAHQAIHDPQMPNAAEAFLTQLGVFRDRNAVSTKVFNSWSAVINSRRGA